MIGLRDQPSYTASLSINTRVCWTSIEQYLGIIGNFLPPSYRDIYYLIHLDQHMEGQIYRVKASNGFYFIYVNSTDSYKLY